MGRDSREHRLAFKPGLTTATKQSGIDFHSEPRRGIEIECHYFSGPAGVRCDVSVHDRTVVGIFDRRDGRAAGAVLPDPLQFAIEEAHKRGMELHAWFNPYRALHKSHVGNISSGHISKTHPQLVRSYGEYLWLDPGERDVQDYSLRVVMDVVKRYDIDGVQFDDYFYPDPTGVNRDFPDDASWKKFGASGNLSRADWRRENVDTFISRVYSSIKAAKPWVKFGVSPFGFWRPGNPPQITGFDAYSKLYADSRKWLMNGWVDYFSPQLYWRIDQKEQSFPVLLDWWAQENVKHRHLWPGMSAAYALSQDWRPGEIPDQIRLVRKQPGDNGYIFYNASSLFGDSPHARDLQHNVGALDSQPALVPASPWLGNEKIAMPNLNASTVAGGVRLNWSRGDTNSVPRWWVVQSKSNNNWKTEVFSKETSSEALPVAPDMISVTAIDRAGNASPARVLELQKIPEKKRILLEKQ